MRYSFTRYADVITCEVDTLFDGTFRLVVRYPDGRADAMSFRSVLVMNAHWKRFVRQLRSDLWQGPQVRDDIAAGGPLA